MNEKLQRQNKTKNPLLGQSQELKSNKTFSQFISPESFFLFLFSFRKVKW